ncbi:MAG: hypothetical protein K2F79_09750, partial [Muribaculaceae bacterium]|nr:hypothetical protein [Muribaculaceae bacterium]
GPDTPAETESDEATHQTADKENSQQAEEPATASAPAEIYIPDIPDTDSPEESDDAPSENPQLPRSQNRLWLWIALIILAACAAGYFAAVHAVPEFTAATATEETEEESIIKAEEEALPEIAIEDVIAGKESASTATTKEVSAPAVAEQPAPEQLGATPAPAPAGTDSKAPRYDTVTSKRFLATMAREYYGAGIFWVYIYEANADHLGNPNQVSPGTRVVIPDKSTLPKASSHKEAIRMAEKKAAEIQARYSRR